MQNIKKIATFLFLICIALNLHSAAQMQSEVDPNSTKKINETREALFKAINEGNVESLRSLISTGVDFKKIGNIKPWEASIIVYVMDNKKGFEFEVVKEMVKILVNAGADVNQVSSWAKTPLNMAIKSNFIDTVKFLLEHGADVNSDSSEVTPLTSAILNYAAPEIFELLFKYGARVDTIETSIKESWKSTNSEAYKLIEKAKKDELARQEAIVKKRQIAISPIIEEHLPKVLSNIISETATHEYADVPEAERR